MIAEHAVKLRDILARLDSAGMVEDMDLPGFRLHPLKGHLRPLDGRSRQLAGDLPFCRGDVMDVDYVDYH